MPRAPRSELLSALLEHICRAVLAGGAPEEIAERVCLDLRRTHGGERYYIPAMGGADLEARILQARRAGAKVRQIAADLGVHPSTVSRTVTRANRQQTGLGTPDWCL
jgi:DNA-binding NarL/FixJ family response regulator